MLASSFSAFDPMRRRLLPTAMLPFCPVSRRLPECTNFQQVIEMALAHTINSKVEAAYRRGDLFDKRRLLMADWAKFLR